MKRKAFSVVLMLALTLGLFPAFAYAADDDAINLQIGVTNLAGDEVAYLGDGANAGEEAGEQPDTVVPGDESETEPGDVVKDGSSPTSIDNARVTLKANKVTYNGKAQKPTVTGVYLDEVAVPLKGYSVSYSNNVNAGTATITIRGKGDYTGTKSVKFTIKQAKASSFAVSSISDKTYNGSAKKPMPSVRFNGKKLRSSIDYKLSYSSNKAAGTAKVTITGKGNFTGTKSVKFKILRASVENAKVASIKSRTYNGNSFYPTPKVTIGGKKLQEYRDYELSYSKNLNAGTARVKVKGVGNYKGSQTVTFEIAKASIGGASVSSISSKKFTGGAITPEPKVTWKGTTLSRGQDYTLSYANNVNAGTATITVKGIGSFTGTKNVNFTIKAPAPAPAPVAPVVVSDTVYITNTGAKYHRDGCSSLSRSRIPISRADAIARGYEACKNCRP